MPLGVEVGHSPGDIVLDGDAAPPQFLAHVYCVFFELVTVESPSFAVGISTLSITVPKI